MTSVAWWRKPKIPASKTKYSCVVVVETKALEIEAGGFVAPKGEVHKKTAWQRGNQCALGTGRKVGQANKLRFPEGGVPRLSRIRR